MATKTLTLDPLFPDGTPAVGTRLSVSVDRDVAIKGSGVVAKKGAVRSYTVGRDGVFPTIDVTPNDDASLQDWSKGYTLLIDAEPTPLGGITGSWRVAVGSSDASTVFLSSRPPAVPVPAQYADIGELITAANDAKTAAQTAQTDAADSADAAAASAASSAASAALVNAPAGDVMAAYALANGLSATLPGLAPLYVQATDNLGSLQAPVGVRTGLPTTAWQTADNGSRPNGQGYKVENIVTGVTGTRGGTTLAVDSTGQAVLATLVTGQTNPWDAAVVSADGTAFFVTVTAWTASTITVLRPLPSDVSAGQLASRIDSVGGQHLTSLGYKALAQAVAGFSPLVGTRGGILDGCWDTRPQQYSTMWQPNAALATYGVKNSTDGGPTVQSSLTYQASLNAYVANNVMTIPNQASPSGIRAGSLAAGHGVTATIRTGGRSAVLEFWTCAYRDNNDNPATQGLQVAVTNLDDGTTVYTRAVTGVREAHRIPLTKARNVRVDVTTSTATPVYLYVSQTTIREAGQGGRISGKKIVLLGDSWTQYADFAFAKELQKATGVQVVTHGYGGTTTDYGLAWWDQYVRAEKPDTVVLHFYTNDLNNNQNSTFVDPSGATVSMWPNGLTQAQAEARWVSNINRMIALAQADGIRPVVVMPGAVNITRQLPAAAHLEQPGLVDWSATATELADATAYVNNVGKRSNGSVKVGSFVKYAQGPNPADAWSNPSDDALAGLQSKTLKKSDYNVSTAIIGTDSNADGLSDGLTKADAGSNTGTTTTYSIVSAAQRQAVAWGNTGSIRYTFTAPIVAGHDYLTVVPVKNATAGLGFDVNSLSNVSGSTVALKSGDAVAVLSAGATSGTLYSRATATTTGTGTVWFGPNNPGMGNSTTWDATGAYIFDLTKLFADAPNLAAKSTADLVGYLLSLAA